MDGKGERSETLMGDEALLRVLAERFGLKFSAGTTFRVASTAAAPRV
jgi:hypothetical protein